MNKMLLILATLVLFANQTVVNAELVVFEQLPAFPAAPGLSSRVGFASASRGLQTADDFVLSAGHRITEIRWWGGCHSQAPPESCSPGGTDQFRFSFYANTGGLPGTLLLETEGLLLADTMGASYAAVLEEPFVAKRGTRYWLSIFNEALHEPWGWVNSAFGNNDSAVANGPDFAVWRDVPGSDVDLAFQLVVPEPAALTLALLGILTTWQSRAKART